jgi:stage IV sporulation protein A
MNFHIPKWLEILPSDHWLKAGVIQCVKDLLGRVNQMKDVTAALADGVTDVVRGMKADRMDLSDGTVSVDVNVDDHYYYEILSDYVGIPIGGEYQLMQQLRSLARMKQEYEKVQNAMSQVRLRGYGVVTPEKSEIVLDEPQVIRHGNKYGVKMRAEAPSINMIKAHIETEIAPIVGSQQQAEDLIAYIKQNARESDEGIWNTNIFGKSIEQIVEDGIQAKVSQLTEDCQMKLQDTLQKIINDSKGGMICIII